MKFETYRNRLILQEFMPLIYKVLYQLSIFQSHYYFEDYVQELSLKLLQLAKRFKGDMLKDSDCRYQFVAYAQKGLYWFGLDLLKKQDKCHSQDIDQVSIKELPSINPSFEANLQISQFFAEAKSRLSAFEFNLLQLLSQYPVSDIADKLSLSRQAIYEKRKKIQNKLATLKPLLSPG